MSRVAVLKGGHSLERQVSRRSGARVEDALRRLGHTVVSIDAGADLIARIRSSAPDAAFIALHGRDGEDGTVQELLENDERLHWVTHVTPWWGGNRCRHVCQNKH